MENFQSKSFLRYWENRYKMFSKFDEGVKWDYEGLFSSKFENDIKILSEKIPGQKIIDGFTGLGICAICFALQGKKVISCELDRKRLKMAIHNAKVYGVEDINFENTNVITLIDRIEINEYDSVYLDPPWGGPAYIKKNSFSLSDFVPNGNVLIEKSLSKKLNVVLTLPENFNFEELSKYNYQYLQAKYYDRKLVHVII